MKFPKKYGQSKVDDCPYCGKQAVIVSDEGIPVCLAHKHAKLNEMKCVCGDYLELMNGKFGVFFKCERCGTMNPKKVFEINEVKDVSGDVVKDQGRVFERKHEKKSFSRFKPKKVDADFRGGKKEIVIRSDDPMYFD